MIDHDKTMLLAEVARLKAELERETKLRMFFERAVKEVETNVMKPSDYICPVCGMTKQPRHLLKAASI